jgi:flagellar motor switch protein FliN
MSSVLERFDAINDVPLTLRAELDRRTISFEDLLELDAGSVITLSRPTGENIDLYAGEVFIASGEILVVEGSLAVRIAYLRDRSATIAMDEPAMAEPSEAT